MSLNLLFSGLLFSISIVTYSQNRVALSVRTGLGYSWFSGKGASPGTDYYTEYLSDKGGHAENPFGAKWIGVGQVGLRASLDLKNNWLAALIVQYECGGGENDVKNVVSPYGSRPTDGLYKRVYEFISLNPTYGKVFKINQFSISLQGGLDYAFGVMISEEFNRADTSAGYAGGIPTPNDLRMTGSLTASLKKWSLDFCYKHGLRSYSNDDNAKAFSNLLQFGLAYRILPWKLK
jgi:hypothetical protein